MTAGTVRKAAAIVMGGMIISRLLGYARYKVIFYYFGRNYQTDAFFGAFTVPDLLYILASGGAMTAAFIPAFSELLEKKREEDAWRMTSGIANIMTVIIGVFVCLGIIYAPELARIIVPGFSSDPKTFNLCVDIIRIIFPMVVLTSISALCNGILHSHNHFTAPTIAWCLHNIGIITSAILLHRVFGIRALAYGVLAGAVSMVAVQMPVIISKGMKYYFTFGLKDPNVRKVLRLFLPAMLGISIAQINLTILPLMFGSFMGKGAVSALQGAERLLMLPLGIFGSAISMAIFPTLSRHVGGGRMDEFKATLIKGTTTTFVFSFPSMVVFMIFGIPITRFLFGGGEFTIADCQATALALFYFAIGIPGHTAVQVFARGYYSLKDTKTPLYIGVASVLLITVPICYAVAEPKLAHDVLEKTIFLKYACMASPFYYLGAAFRFLEYSGVALAISVATLFNITAQIILFKRHVPDFAYGPILGSLARVGVATLVMAAACYGSLAATAKLDPAIQLFAGMSVGGLVFLAVGRIMKIEEIDEVIRMFRARFSRG